MGRSIGVVAAWNAPPRGRTPTPPGRQAARDLEPGCSRDGKLAASDHVCIAIAAMRLWPWTCVRLRSPVGRYDARGAGAPVGWSS